MPPEYTRFSDDRLQAFYQEFKEHCQGEDAERQQQRALYDAVFRLEDSDRGIPPGLMQMTKQTVDHVLELRIRDDRRKNFIGGMIFTVSAVWVFVSGILPKLIEWLHKAIS